MTTQCPVGHGSRYNPFTNPQLDHPHPIWAAARDEAPVEYSDALNAWVVTPYALVREVLAAPQVFLNAGSTAPIKPAPPEVLDVLATGLPASDLKSTVSRDGAEHQRIRKFLLGVLTPRRFEDLEGSTRAIADQFIDGFIDDGRADLVDAFAFRLPLSVIIELMATPQADADQLHEWSSKKMALYWGDLALDDHIEAARSFVDFQMYLKNVVEARRANPGDDVISELIRLEMDERPLTDAEIVGIMLGFVAAGHETTMNFLSLTVLHSLEHPGTWGMLGDDPSLIPALLEESLRFDSPAQAVWRTVGQDTELGGVSLAAGARVLLVLGSANRDPAAFSEADWFTLQHEQTSPHVAFGRGLHFCVGAGLARLEGKVALEQLTRRLPGLRLADDYEPHFAPNAVQRFLLTLPVEWPTAR